MTTLPTRISWPGFSSISRVWPLRLLSNPITATRSAIGVPSCAPCAWAIGTALVFALPLIFDAWLAASLLLPHAASDNRGSIHRQRRSFISFQVSMAGNRPLPLRVCHPLLWRHRANKLGCCRSGCLWARFPICGLGADSSRVRHHVYGVTSHAIRAVRGWRHLRLRKSPSGVCRRANENNDCPHRRCQRLCLCVLNRAKCRWSHHPTT